jgi:hypothetical protein
VTTAPKSSGGWLYSGSVRRVNVLQHLKTPARTNSVQKLKCRFTQTANMPSCCTVRVEQCKRYQSLSVPCPRLLLNIMISEYYLVF